MSGPGLARRPRARLLRHRSGERVILEKTVHRLGDGRRAGGIDEDARPRILDDRPHLRAADAKERAADTHDAEAVDVLSPSRAFGVVLVRSELQAPTDRAGERS